MQTTRHSSLIILIILFCSSRLWAQAYPDFEPAFSMELVFDGGDVPAVYTADEVFKLGLLFSECTPDSENWNRCLSEFEKIKRAVSTEEMLSLKEDERGRAVLKYLYNEYLTTYSLNQTRLDVALENGSYNCVSSAVLYLAAAKAAGLQVYGQRTTQHAFCSIYVPSQKAGQTTKIDVETTNPYGFNPGSKEEIENESQIKRYYVVPKKYYANRQEVSDAVFTGLIAGNLCSDYIKSGDYQKAIPLGAARYEAVRAEKSKAATTVRNEFDILPCNYVNIIPETGEEYASMLEWFTTFIERWGSNDFVQKNMDSSFNNLFVFCIKENDFELAEESFRKLSPYVSQKQLEKSQDILADIYFLSNIQGLEPEEQVQKILSLMNAEDFPEVRRKRAELFLENSWLEVLNMYMQIQDYEDGYTISLEALEQLPKSANIKRMSQTFYSNSIAIIHNSFAKLANAGEYEQALQVLEEGLQTFPNDKTLTRDLADINKILVY